MTRTHELKTWPEAFEAVADGSKPFEVRWDDRDYRVGDRLLLQEYLPGHEPGFTGREISRDVTFILTGGRFGLPVGLVVMGLCDPASAGPLSLKELKVLEVLNKGSEYSYGFAYIASKAGLELEITKHATRLCAAQGYAVFCRGLFSEDGETAGSGYSITTAGVDVLAKHQAGRGETITGALTFYADPKNWLAGPKVVDDVRSSPIEDDAGDLAREVLGWTKPGPIKIEGHRISLTDAAKDEVMAEIAAEEAAERAAHP